MSDPICPTCKKPITDQDVVMHHNCLEPIETELWQAKGELGYPVPGHIPQSKTLKCGLCEAKAKQIDALREKLEIAKRALDALCRRRESELGVGPENDALVAQGRDAIARLGDE